MDHLNIARIDSCLKFHFLVSFEADVSPVSVPAAAKLVSELAAERVIEFAELAVVEPEAEPVAAALVKLAAEPVLELGHGCFECEELPVSLYERPAL